MEFSLFSGLLINLLITIGSSIIPVVVGLLLYMICSNKGTIPNWGKLFGLFFECCCPVVLLLLVYYTVGFNIGRINNIVACIIAFTISFLAYMPKRYNLDFSFKKNLIVNILGLLSCVFKWSFCVSMIGVHEMFGQARLLLHYADLSGMWIVFGVSFAIIFILELMKHVAKEKL